MSLISCTQNCVYQSDGYCTLEQAVTNRQAVPNDFCVNFTPKKQPKPAKPEPQAPHEYF